MKTNGNLNFTHRTTISITGETLYDAPIEIRDQTDLDNYHITWNDCTTFSFGGTDTRTIYFYPTPSRDLAEFLWQDLNKDHSRKSNTTRCMVPGERKPLKRCPTGNACTRCPYGNDPADRQINVISFDQLTENAGERKYTEESAGNPTEEIGILRAALEQAQEALDKADPRLMTVLRRKYLEGYTAEEIRCEMGCSLPRVYQLEKEALKRIRDFLSE